MGGCVNSGVTRAARWYGAGSARDLLHAVVVHHERVPDRQRDQLFARAEAGFAQCHHAVVRFVAERQPAPAQPSRARDHRAGHARQRNALHALRRAEPLPGIAVEHAVQWLAAEIASTGAPQAVRQRQHRQWRALHAMHQQHRCVRYVSARRHGWPAQTAPDTRCSPLPPACQPE